MKRRFLAIALTLCMLFSLMPVSAFAAETYELYINEFQFSSSNLTYNGKTGTAVYNPSAKTLTLNNLTVSTTSFNTLIYSEISGLTIQINGTLTINLLDSNPINGKDAATAVPNYGIVLNGNTTIRGTNNNVDKDCIIINSKSVGVHDNDFSDGTTRLGIATGGGAALTMENITVRMTDNSTGSYAGHASMIRAVGNLAISGCKLEANQCQLGVYMDAYVPATIRNTVFAMDLNGTATSGVNCAPGTVNVLENCSGSISADYPIYTAGQLTISDSSKLTLAAGKMGVVATQSGSYAGGKVMIDNANLEIQSEDLGLEAEAGGSITMKSGTVSVTKATYGVQVTEGSSFAMQGGTLSIRGADTTNCVGIKTKGTVTVTGGSLNVENVYTAIQNDSSTALSVTGGEHTLTAATCGYLGDTSSELKISNTAKVTINADTGIQLPASSSSKLTVSGGELNINATYRGIDLVDGTSAMTLSGGKVNVTDKNSTPTITGMVCVGKSLFSGAEVTFSNCKIDLQSRNSNNKMTGGKLHLSGYGSGAQFYFGFEMTGGEIDGSSQTFGIVAANGTTTLKGGTVNITASYPFCLTYGGIVDFAGTNVTGNATANCGLYVTDATEDSYKISGGTVVLTSTQAGANELYTSIPSNYGVWAGADEAGATLVANPTQPILASSKYVRFAEKKAQTLTLVDVKEGTSASYLPGESFTYTAKDAPSGKHFSHWELTVNGSTTNVGTGTTYSGKMPAGNATLTAVYENCSGGTATCKQKAVCKTCGKEYGELAAHSYTAEVAEAKYLKTAATCTDVAVYYKSCAVCGASSKGTASEATFSYGEALGHDWGAWTSNGDDTHSRTCSRDDKHTETKNCSGGTADCQHLAVCDTCHAEYGILAAHRFTEEVEDEKYVITPATCEGEGTYYKSCSVCGASAENWVDATFTVPALGHTESGWRSDADGHWKVCTVCGEITTVKAVHTPDHEGHATEEYAIKCSACGWEIEAQLSHTHSLNKVDAKDATCTEDGNIEYYQCSGCGKLFADAAGSVQITDPDSVIISALKHDWADATCTSPKTCKRCGNTEGKSLGHDYEWIVDKEATETEAGSKHEECKVCHDKKAAVEIPATGPVNDTEELQRLLDAGGTVKLEKDYTIISALKVNSTVILDLNGHTITSLCAKTAYWALYVGRGRSLTLTDSSAGKTGRLTNAGTVDTGIYVSGGSFVMAGGTIDGFLLDVEVHDSSTFTMTGGTLRGAADGLALFMAGGAGSNYAYRPTMYADGGTVDGNADFYNCTVTKSPGAAGETVFNGEVTITGCGDKMVTIRCGVFRGAVKNGGTIAGGIFYGGLTHINDIYDYDSDGKLGENAHTITFMDGETPYAVEVLDSGADSYAPVAPTQTGCTFDGWYNGDAEYSFGSAITEDLTLNAHWTADQYTITLNANGGTVEPSTLTTGDGWKLTSLPTPTRSGYSFDGWFTAAEGGTEVTVATVFAEATTIYAHWTAIPTYPPTVEQPEDGTVTISPTDPTAGSKVTVTPKPDKDYKVDEITVTDQNGNPVKVTDNGDGTYSFIQPAGNVTIMVVFKDATVVPFVDVPADEYYYHAVQWAVRHGITNGTSAATFSPNAPCTRAQMVTFLWRAAGCPTPTSSEMPFKDVVKGSYYETAVLWAVENGITNGISATTFSPNAICTRAQIVTFLWRYQGKPAAGTANPFTDVAKNAYYTNAVLWAVENGITQGTSASSFSPNNPCKRAETMTFLYRCLGK